MDDEQITQLLEDWSKGDKAALNRLMDFAYDELHRIARREMRKERLNHTLQTTALVHELYARLARYTPRGFDGRNQFLCLAGKIMRNVLTDHARALMAERRGAGAVKLQLEEDAAINEMLPVDILALDEALIRLAAQEERKAKVIELEFFAGLTYTQIAEVLGVGASTVKRDSEFAKAWLRRELTQTTK